ncbi:MAG: OmpA family protein [Hyphomicrobiaceae bacterium]|nr:OmpA family protein [Hyphomicrobiaceae bacterium]
MKRTFTLVGLLLLSASPLAAEHPTYRELSHYCPPAGVAADCRHDVAGVLPAQMEGPLMRALAIERDGPVVQPSVARDLFLLATDDQRGWSLEQLLDFRKVWGAGDAATAEVTAVSAAKPVNQAEIDKALKALLEERASWGEAPAGKVAQAPQPGAVTPASTAEPQNLAEYLKRRDEWGTAKAKPVAAPLAAGAPKRLPQTAARPVAADKRAPIVHAAEERAIPVVADPPKTTVEANLKSLLAERASWGTAPKVTSWDFATAEPQSLAEYLKRRDEWGTAKAKPVAAPLAAGAPKRLPQTAAVDVAPAAAAGPVVHAAEERPLPTLAAIAPTKITAALDALLAERSSWGLTPTVSAAMAEAAPSPGIRVADASPSLVDMPTTLKGYLGTRATWGAKPSMARIAEPAAAATATAIKKGAPAVAAAPAVPAQLVDMPTTLKGYLGTRETWGTKPALARLPGSTPGSAAPSSAVAASAVPSQPTEFVDMPTTLKGYLATRQGWGTAPVRSTDVAGRSATSNIVTSAIGKPGEATARTACESDINRILGSGSILFETASADIVAESSPTLRELAGVIRDCRGLKVRIEGHTDSFGKMKVNQRLSAARARAVAKYMVEAGVEADRVDARGFGETRPIASNATPEERARNRRIEVRVLSR